MEILNYYTVGQIAEFMDVALEPWMNIYVNNQLADKETPVYENFTVLWTKETLPGISPVPETTAEETKETKETGASDPVKQTDLPNAITVIANNQVVVLEGKSKYVFVDVFEKIDFDRSRPRGMGIVATLNGHPAQYMEPIHDGDVLEIYWRT